MSSYEAVQRAAEAIRARGVPAPRVAIVLGTGLGGVGARIEGRVAIPYDEIPGFARPTVASHKGELVFGRIGACPVAAMEGRFHYYEGYTGAEIALPIRALRALGAQVLAVSGACGGMNPTYEKGDLVLVEDHINLMGANPLVGPNDERVGPRFPDMTAPYDRDLIRRAAEVAKAANVRAHTGVYVAVTGPNLETRAEYRFLRRIGADVVGMSVVPEVLVAVHCGMRVFGIAIVTDQCFPETLHPVTIDEVIAIAQAAEPRMAVVVNGLVQTL